MGEFPENHTRKLFFLVGECSMECCLLGGIMRTDFMVSLNSSSDKR